MKNKVLVNINIPEIDQDFDLYIPLNKTVNTIIDLLEKTINLNSREKYLLSRKGILIDYDSGIKYNGENLIKETDIRNGSRLILLT